MMTRQEAAAPMYAAQERVAAATVGTDEYLEARLAFIAARDAYRDNERARLSGYVNTIRKA